VALFAGVATRLWAQEAKCSERFTPCVWHRLEKRVYMEDGVLEATSCAVAHVRSVDASGCGLERVPDALHEFVEALSIDLRDNPNLSEVPGVFARMVADSEAALKIELDPCPEVRAVDWSGAGLKRLPVVSLLSKMPALVRFNASGNELSDVVTMFDAPAISALLATVDLSDNALVALPTRLFDIAAFPALRHVDVSANALQGLSEALARWAFSNSSDASGRTVRFRDNPVERVSWSGLPVPYLHPDLGTLTTMQELWLMKCGLEGTLPTWLGRLTRLRTVQLDWNRIEGGIPTQVGRLSKLETLSAIENSLQGTCVPPSPTRPHMRAV
jgi:Leucine-rich repeat (LRR) protein